jgi:hypothetical protein
VFRQVVCDFAVRCSGAGDAVETLFTPCTISFAAAGVGIEHAGHSVHVKSPAQQHQRARRILAKAERAQRKAKRSLSPAQSLVLQREADALRGQLVSLADAQRRKGLNSPRSYRHRSAQAEGFFARRRRKAYIRAEKRERAELRRIVRQMRRLNRTIKGIPRTRDVCWPERPTLGALKIRSTPGSAGTA